MQQISNPKSSIAVLVVDDEESIRTILSRYLALKGYTVLTAPDGNQAMEILHSQPVDLVLTDLMMPNVNGRELLQKMAELFPEIPKIVLSGYGTNEDMLVALKTGAYDFIQKPLTDFEILDKAVERAVESKLLKEERDRYIQQLTYLNDIIGFLNKGVSLEQIFDIIASRMKKAIPFNRLAIALINDAGLVETTLVSSDKPVLIKPGATFPLEESSLVLVAQTKKYDIISDLEEYSKKHNSEKARLLLQEGMQSTMTVPLVVGGRLKGFLLFASCNKNAFAPEHVQFAETISGHIVFSLQRGELLHQLDMYNKKLEEIVKIRTHQLLKTQKATIFALSSLAELRDPETGYHLERIRGYCMLLAQIAKYTGGFLEINNQFLRDLYDSSILHDIGKVGIPDSILLKPGKLTHEEFEIIKTHTTIGYNSLKRASEEMGRDSFLNMAMDVTLYHHEAWDGSGYPHALSGEDIPLAARIVTIADVYDALTTVRPYKAAFDHQKAIAIMNEESHRYDPKLFELFIQNADDFDEIRNKYQ
ncbi:MAG TPA: response regulator [Spirochaetota bacterium]|nr:response regulator [Spirochaetota bacterium]HOM08658.1 response regulator [Spirochaetota bacterium]HPP48551.1 response regulator [Spirochaetota bacterium]